MTNFWVNLIVPLTEVKDLCAAQNCKRYNPSSEEIETKIFT